MDLSGNMDVSMTDTNHPNGIEDNLLNDEFLLELGVIPEMLNDEAALNKLISCLDERLQTEESVTYILKYMQYTQLKLNSMPEQMPSNTIQSGSTRTNDTSIEPKIIRSKSIIEKSKNDINYQNGNDQTHQKPEIRLTTDEAKIALNKKYLERQKLYHDDFVKAVDELIKPKNLPIVDMNFVPSTVSNHFMGLVGLEEVIDGFKSFQKENMETMNDVKYTRTDAFVICKYCTTDESPLWRKRKAESGEWEIFCQKCGVDSFKKNYNRDYESGLFTLVEKFNNLNNILHRDYKDLLNCSTKMEQFRNDIEKQQQRDNQISRDCHKSRDGHKQQSLIQQSSTANNNTRTPPQLVPNGGLIIKSANANSVNSTLQRHLLKKVLHNNQDLNKNSTEPSTSQIPQMSQHQQASRSSLPVNGSMNVIYTPTPTVVNREAIQQQNSNIPYLQSLVNLYIHLNNSNSQESQQDTQNPQEIMQLLQNNPIIISNLIPLIQMLNNNNIQQTQQNNGNVGSETNANNNNIASVIQLAFQILQAQQNQNLTNQANR